MVLKFTDFKSFLNSVQLITCEELEKARKILKTEGKEIESIDDIFINTNGELFEFLPDGTLVRVNLYIATKDNMSSYDIRNINRDELYKYHIYHCATISNMFASGRKHRYKINNRDNGTFYYTFTNSYGKTLKVDENQKLNICKHCLIKFSHRKVTNEDVRKFNLKDFYNNRDNFFNFDTSEFENGENARPNVYSKLWDKISQQIRIVRDYTCENCGYKADRINRKFIHTHHVNGNKQNNDEDNLQVLCIKCHSEVDCYHSRLKSSPEYMNFISKNI